jgi:hypothetical protein
LGRSSRISSWLSGVDASIDVEGWARFEVVRAATACSCSWRLVLVAACVVHTYEGTGAEPLVNVSQ